MTKDKEIRAGAPVALRAVEGGEGVRVGGYAAVFNEWADMGSYFQEIILPGAFDGAAMDDVQFLINHRGLPLARTTSGTLKLTVDERGLFMETTLDPSDPDAARIIPKIKRGDLSKMSFAFVVDKDEWDETGDVTKRTIKQFRRVLDVAVVNEPAYHGTDIGLRSLEAHRAAQAAKNSQPEARVRRMRMDWSLAALS